MSDLNDYEEMLLAFEQAWQRGVPELGEFVERIPSCDRELVRDELILIDLEHRLKRGMPRDIDDYVASFPELRQDPSRIEKLVQEELILRANWGVPLSVAEIQHRYGKGSNLTLRLVDSLKTLRSSGVTSTQIEVGTNIQNYVVEEMIGQGAFASVYRASDTKLGRDVAIKVLKHFDGRSDDAIARLEREARTQALLRHPNIAPVLDFGEFEGKHFLVTRYVRGQTLEQALDREEISERQGAEICKPLAEALHHAHLMGVVHRDIKPANILLDADEPILLDFGLARWDDSSKDLTQEGDVIGTPAYMAPEQAAGKGWQADPRADIYSLGAVLFRITCGRIPFEGSTVQVFHQVLNTAPTKPRTIRPSVSLDLQRIILKCLEKNPEDRYQSAIELAQDLRRFQDGLPVLARPMGPVAHSLRWAQKNPGIAGLILLTVVLCVFLAGSASQMQIIAQQRDRAQDAEQRTQAMLAESKTSSGSLAMQRGKIDQAILDFESALELGAADRADLLVRLVEAHFIKRETARSAQLLREAMQLETSSLNEARLSLWQKELSLEGLVGFEDESTQVASRFDSQDNTADYWYARGIEAETAPEAVRMFQNALKIDSFHFRARRMLIVLLLSISQFEDCGLEIGTALQLFPDDQDFRLLQVVELACLGNVEAAKSNLQSLELEFEKSQKWLDFVDFLHRARVETSLSSGSGTLEFSRLFELYEEFQQSYLPLIAERRWRMPPIVSERLRRALEFRSQLLGAATPEALEALDSAVQALPDGILQIARAELSLAQVQLADGSPNEAVRYLREARELFRVAIDSRSFIRGTPEFGWMGVFSTSALLAIVFQENVPANREIYRDALAHISVDTLDSPSSARFVALAALQVDELSVAKRWFGRLRDLTLEDEVKHHDALWHLAIIAQRTERWQEVLEHCDELLTVAPEHKEARSFRRVAESKLAELMGAEASDSLESGDSERERTEDESH